MNDITDRFLDIYNYLLTNKKVTGKADFAQKIQVSSSMITDITKKRSNPGISVVRNIIFNFPEIDAEWLLVGEGDMLKKYTNTSSTPRVEEGFHFINRGENQYTPYAKSGKNDTNQAQKLSPTLSPTHENCRICEEKERIIANQQVAIDTLRELVDQLRIRVEELGGQRKKQAG